MAGISDATAAALDLITTVERCRLVAYLGDHGMPVIGYGLERYGSGAQVCLRDVTSPPAARGEMEVYLSGVIEPLASVLPAWGKLGTNRRAALMSFMQGVGSAIAGDNRCRDLLAALREGENDLHALNGVPDQMRRFVTDALGRVNSHLVNRRQREAEYWSREDSAMARLRAAQDTFLKRAPTSSDYLSDTGRRFIKKGDAIEALEVTEIPRDSHDWVRLKGEKEPWALFMPHWEQPDSELRPDPSGAVNWADFDALVGQYLTVGEILRYDARRQPVPGSQAEQNLRVLAKEFDAIRSAWGGPVAVTSGYRPEPINSQVGGVPNSRHVSGEALDVYPSNGDLDGFYRWIRRRWSGGLGDGRNKGFVHLDLRGNGRFHPRGGVEPAAVWLY